MPRMAEPDVAVVLPAHDVVLIGGSVFVRVHTSVAAAMMTLSVMTATMMTATMVPSAVVTACVMATSMAAPMASTFRIG